MSRAKSFNTNGNSVSNFQFRFHEALGPKECPYAYRWCLITPWFSIRIHNFIRSDDKRFLHDHAWDFITFILKGKYTDVGMINDKIVKQERKWLHCYRIPAAHKHYVDVPKGGCWTLVFTGPMIRKWGFWVNGKFKRPLKYFYKYGHPPCSEQ